MLHDDFLCLVEFGKQQIKEVRRKFNRKTWKQRQLLSECGFVLRIAPPPLSRDRRIKMKKSINQKKVRKKHPYKQRRTQKFSLRVWGVRSSGASRIWQREEAQPGSWGEARRRRRLRGSGGVPQPPTKFCGFHIKKHSF